MIKGINLTFNRFTFSTHYYRSINPQRVIFCSLALSDQWLLLLTVDAAEVLTYWQSLC